MNMEVTPITKPHTFRSPEGRKIYRADHPTCELCGNNFGLAIHHLKTKGSGGGDEASNLMALCFNHHHRAHNVPGFNEALKRWKLSHL